MTTLYGFAYSKVALGFLATCPKKVRRQIRKKIDALAQQPHPNGCKKLHGVLDGGEPVYRLRSGDYRVLYSVRARPKQIIILDIDNRKDVYK